MITNPPIDKLTELAGDKYALCCVVSKRAKTVNQDELPAGQKPISFVAKEFGEGETTIKGK